MVERDILKDLLSRKPTAVLYHYTTQAGLLGIIESKEIWATHTQYLNDAREYRHAVDLVNAEIEKRSAAAAGDSHRILADMSKGAEGIENINVCVCSFSEDGDSLSQWRAYGGSTSGYAIGFSPTHLAEIVMREERSNLVPCLYDPTEQIAVIEALVDKVFEENIKRLHDGEKLVSENPMNGISTKKLMFPGGNLAAYLNRYAPILKHEAFSAEKEWRIISRPLMCTHDRFGFRSGNSTLIPFYRVPIAHSDRPLEIDEVVIGPTPSIDLSSKAVRSLLVSKWLHDVPVKHSRIPYRNW
jgi:hypothetical protein